PLGRPGRAGDRRPAALAGRADQAQHGHHLRRRGQRGHARADRHRRAQAAAGAAMSAGQSAEATAQQILSGAEKVRAGGASAPRAGRDPINQPMVNNWVEAIGDANPIYTDEAAARAAGHPGVVAPPAMAQVWTMRGLHGERTADDPLGLMTEILDEAGYTSVVATNCNQIYHRYLTPGEEVTIESVLEDVVEIGRASC